MTFSAARSDGSGTGVDRALDVLAAAVFLTLAPLAALAPRGLPVWAIVATLTALATLARAGRLVRTGTEASPYGRAGMAATVTLLAVAAVSVAWSPSPRALATVAEMGYVALGALLVGRWIATLTPAAALRLGLYFVIGLTIAVLLFATEAALDFPLHRWWNGVPADRVVDITNVPKRTAAVLALLAWPGALVLHRSGRAVALALPLLYAAASLLLSSRSALLGMAIGIGFYALATSSPALTRRLIGGVLAAAFVLAVPVALALDHLTNANPDLAEWLFPSARHRVEIWGHAAWRVLDAPLLGHGIDASRAIRPHAGEWSRFGPLTDSLLPLHPHNAFLQVWLELGLAGAVLALATSLLVLAGTARLPRPAQPYALALYAGGVAMASTAYGLWQAWWMAAYLAAGLLVLLAARAEDRR